MYSNSRLQLHLHENPGNKDLDAIVVFESLSSPHMTIATFRTLSSPSCVKRWWILQRRMIAGAFAVIFARQDSHILDPVLHPIIP
jgi:hypothetical protein